MAAKLPSSDLITLVSFLVIFVLMQLNDAAFELSDGAVMDEVTRGYGLISPRNQLMTMAYSLIQDSLSICTEVTTLVMPVIWQQAGGTLAVPAIWHGGENLISCNVLSFVVCYC
ncbi:hypothetical protein Ancab_000370 [Ancistrocladus abbreviatus]